MQTRNSVVDVWGERTPYAHEPWPQRIDVHTAEVPERWVQSEWSVASITVYRMRWVRWRN